MKRFASTITFLFFLVLILEIRLRVVDTSTSSSSFVFMMLITVWSFLFGGIVLGILMLFLTSGMIGYYFLTPQDLSQLTTQDMNQMGLFILEGIAILLLIAFLKRRKEQEHDLRERFQVILSSIGDAVIATNKKGEIQYMNVAAQRLTGWRFREARGKLLKNILKMEDPEDSKFYNEQLVGVIQSGKMVAIEKPLSFLNKKKLLVDIQDTIAPLKNMDGHIIGLVLIFRDVTDHREMEEQKEALLGSISHELKNYITSIQGYTHIVRKKTLDTHDEKLISYADKLSDKVETMKNMIISMLDLSKLKVGKLDMSKEDFDIEDLVTTIINDLQISTKHIIKMKGIMDLRVTGDKIRIGQVLTNLLSNAIKYSPEEKEIQIILERQDSEAVIGVKDYGRGISREKMEKIFKPFYRAVNDEDKVSISGSGLGLYVSKEIIKQHGGSIWVKSEEGKGSTFSFSLPIAAADLEEYGELPKDHSFIAKIKKLLKIERASSVH